MLKRLIQILTQTIGIHFVPDNHVVPVLRLGRSHRVAEPGYFWINPFFEQILPPIKTSLQTSNFVFEEILSKNGIPFKVFITVLFTFNITIISRNVATAILRANDDLLSNTLKDYTNRGLRSLAAKYNAEMLMYAETLSSIEEELTSFLIAEMRMIGIQPLKRDGILIKKVVAPDKFKQAILERGIREVISTEKIQYVSEFEILISDIKLLRRLVATAFDDEELTNLCFDHFRPVYENFATGLGKGEKVRQSPARRHSL